MISWDLRHYADDLRRAERFGTAEDSPEGSRYIRMSHTLAEKLAATLNTAALELEIRLERKRSEDSASP